MNETILDQTTTEPFLCLRKKERFRPILVSETAEPSETTEKVIKFLVKSAFYKKLKVIRFSKHEKPPKWYNGC